MCKIYLIHLNGPQLTNLVTVKLYKLYKYFYMHYYIMSVLYNIIKNITEGYIILTSSLF